MRGIRESVPCVEVRSKLAPGSPAIDVAGSTNSARLSDLFDFWPDATAVPTKESAGVAGGSCRQVIDRMGHVGARVHDLASLIEP